MAKDLRLDVVTSDDPKGLIGAAAGLDEVADKADKVGHQFEETAVAGAFLAKELEAVKLKQNELARAFDETGDRSLLKAIQANKRYETQLKNVGHALEDVGKDAEKEGVSLGENLGKSTKKGLFDELGDIGPSWLKLLATPEGLAGAAAGGLLVGQMVGGAVLTGIGLAGIGGGIAIALHDPKVKAALDGFKSDVGSTLKDAAQPFVEPLETAIDRLGTNITTEIGPGLKSMFTDLAPEVLTLEKGVEGFLDSTITGFEHAAVAAKPLLDDLGNNDLPAIGAAIGNLFDTIANHADEAKQGLDQLTTATVLLVNSGSRVIDIFSRVDAVTHKFSGGVLGLSDGFDNVNEALKSVGIPMSDLIGTTDSVLIKFGATEQVIQANTRALKLMQDEWTNLDKQLSNELAIDAAKDAISGLKDQVDKHSHSLDQDTAKGRINREAYAGSIKTLEEQRDQLIKNGMSASDANKLFQGWIKALDKAAEKAGFSADQIADMNRQLGLIPKSKTVTIKIRHTGDSGVSLSNSGLKFYADGGHYQAGKPRVVGENGPEFDIPDHSGTIVPNSALRGSGGAGMPVVAGGGTQRIEVVLKGETPALRALMAMLSAEVRTQFRGNVQVALGGGR